MSRFCWIRTKRYGAWTFGASIYLRRFCLGFEIHSGTFRLNLGPLALEIDYR